MDHITERSRVLYKFKCDSLDCDDKYIGELSTTFGERFKEHFKSLSPIYDHGNTTGPTTAVDNIIIHKGQQSIPQQEVLSATHME